MAAYSCSQAPIAVMSGMVWRSVVVDAQVPCNPVPATSHNKPHRLSRPTAEHVQRLRTRHERVWHSDMVVAVQAQKTHSERTFGVPRHRHIRAPWPRVTGLARESYVQLDALRRPPKERTEAANSLGAQHWSAITPFQEHPPPPQKTPAAPPRNHFHESTEAR